MMENETDRNLVKFHAHLSESESARRFVYEWLKSEGYNVLMPRHTVTDTYRNRMRHRDGGDLIIMPSTRIEVKKRGVKFTSEDDFPYPDFIVCQKHSWDLAPKKPFCYIILNNEKTHAAVAFGKDVREWSVRTITDRRYENYTREYYISPLGQIVFGPVTNGFTDFVRKGRRG